MTDDIWTRDEIESPCVKVCVLHPQERICVGCYRTEKEIERWTGLSAETRRRIMAELPTRGAKLNRRRGGRRRKRGVS